MSSDDQSEQFFSSDLLNEEFFVEVVEKRLRISRESFKINLVLISPALSSNNENYASVVYRAKIKINLLETSEMKVVNVIMKASLVNIPELKEYGVFPRERFMYEEILSSFERIWLEKSGEEIQFGPQGIKFAAEPYEVIVLDDLKASGYVMLDRKEGITVEQGKAVLSKLAKYHAISALRYQKEGVVNRFFDRKNSQVDVDSVFAKGFIRMFDEVIKSLEEFDDCKIYVEKLKKFDRQVTINAFLNDDKALKCDFKVLTHGDLWVNNVMFKIDEDKTECILIDFQMSFWGSPTYDLVCFLLSSINDDLRAKHFDELVESYHRELSSALKIIEYEHHIPSLAEIFGDIMEKKVLSALIPSYMFFIKYSNDDAINFEALMNEQDEEILNGMYRRIYSCPLLQKSIKSMLPFLNERGFLDFMSEE